jgi:hypothetical protein
LTLPSIPEISEVPAAAEFETQPAPPSAHKHLLRRIVFGLLSAVGAFVLIVVLDGWFTRLPALNGTLARGERVGVLHVHTNLSCGSGSLPQVITAAKDADLSFLAITDHNLAMSQAAVNAADPPDFAVIDGEEVSTSTGHFLALGVSDAWPRGSSYDARTLLASARQAGAVNFIAHPFGLREHWHEWASPDYVGMEIWNDDAVWRQNNALSMFTSFLLYPFNSRLALVRLARTPSENLAKWDELQLHRHVAGICGSDAHAAITVDNRTIARFPGYYSVFSLIRQHILLNAQADPDHAGASVILDALKQGNSFCAVDALAPSNGFVQSIASAHTSPQTAGPGDSIAYSPGATLHVAVPAGSPPAILRILRDGREIAKQQTQSLDLPVPGPGSYRAEAYLRQPGLTSFGRWTLWIFANPVNVTSAPTASQ